MDKFDQAALKIIEEQQGIIGPLAVEQAKKVRGLKVDLQNKSVVITGDKSKALDSLVSQYREFFGQTSVEVCKDAVKSILIGMPQAQIPDLLR